MNRRAAVAIAAGAVAVLLLAAGAWWWLSTRPQSAEGAARAYLDALAAGDVGAIDALRADPLAPEAEELLRQAFAGASAYVTDPRVTEIEVSGATAVVTARAGLGGEGHDLAFSLRNEGGRWVLTGDELGVLTVQTALGDGPGADAVHVGDALAAVGEDLALLPAVYEVEAAPRGILSGSATAAVSPGAPRRLTLETEVSPEATALAQAQLDAYVEECTRPADAVPDDCGLRVPWAADLASLDTIAFRVEERPVVVLSDDGSGFDATGGVVVATASGTTRDGGPGAFTYRADDWALRGGVRFTGDEMVLSVR
ncbi:hypothetical protein [Microbacterium sp. HJ5]